jgi:hypothetical protein
MTRASYVKHLEHDLEASRKAINDLIQENHQLREFLKAVTTQIPTHEPRPHKH